MHRRRRWPSTEEVRHVDVRDAALAFPSSGRVMEVLKHEGERVVAGEVIARLDSEPQRLAPAQAQAAARVAEARLRRTEAGARREDLAEASAVLAQRQATRRRADDNLQRT